MDLSHLIGSWVNGLILLITGFRFKSMGKVIGLVRYWEFGSLGGEGRGHVHVLWVLSVVIPH